MTKRTSVRVFSGLPCSLVLSVALACAFSSTAAPRSGSTSDERASGELERRGVTFYAPLDGDAVAVHARGNPRPVFVDAVGWVEGRFGRAVLTRQSREKTLGHKGRATGLTYDAAGHLYGERGTLAYWYQPLYDADDPGIRTGPNSAGPFMINVSALEDTNHRQFLRAHIKGPGFYVHVVDLAGKPHGTSHRKAIGTWKNGDWHHLVFTWDASQGVRFYDNGELQATYWGKDPYRPATPWRIGLGTDAPLARPQSTVQADAVYDELVMLDRAVSSEEVALLMQGRLRELDPSPPVAYSARQLDDRRLSLLIEDDVNRPAIVAENGEARASWSRVQAEDIQMRFIGSDLLGDGRWQPQVKFAQGGFAMSRDATITTADGARANAIVVAGVPAEGASFSLRTPDVPLQTTKAGAARRLLPEALDRVVLEIPGGSRVGEIQLFEFSPGPAAAQDRSVRRWQLASRAEPRLLEDQGVALLRRIDARDRMLLAPGPATPGLFPVSVPPTGTLSLASERLAEDTAIGRVGVTLQLASVATSDVIRVTIPRPWEGDASYLSASMGLRSTGSRNTLELRLDGPGMIFPAGSRLVVELTSSQGFELGAPPELAVDLVPAEREAEAFARDTLRQINEEFTDRMSHNFRFYMAGIDRDNPLTRALARVLRFDPDNDRALEMLHWARIEPWPAFKARAPGPSDFPDVVKHARMAALEARDAIHWWIDQRQDESGYFVGRADEWNDDTKLLGEYAFLSLLNGDPKLTDAIEKYLRAHWASGRTIKGWSKMLTDVVHAGEEASYLEPTMALLDYGDPLHIERLMQTAANVAQWTGVNVAGHRHFRSNYFNADEMKTGGTFGRDVGLNSTAMTASMYLAWYSRHPRARGEFLEWVDGWIADSMRGTPQKPAGRIPAWVDFESDDLGAFSASAYNSELTMMFNAAYQLTGDEKYLGPLSSSIEANRSGWPGVLNMAAADLRRDLGRGPHDAAMQGYADARTTDLEKGYFFQRGLFGQELPAVLGRLILGDVDYLDVAARHAWRNNTYARDIYTVLDPHKDRVYPWGRYLLPWIQGGGNALNQRGSGPYPTIQVSWVDSGYDFAALVHPSDRRHLRLTAYNFAGAREVGLRVWRVDPGIYEVEIRPRDGEVERREVQLHRGEQLRFDLPTESSVDVELTRIRAGDWSAERPDLALSEHEGATSKGNRLTVIVHNIGSRRSPVCKAALMRGEERIAEASIPAIAAPLDLSPRTANVSFVVPDDIRGNLRVVIDSDDEVAEITEVNNTLATMH